jgi:hypothetical protein
MAQFYKIWLSHPAAFSLLAGSVSVLSDRCPCSAALETRQVSTHNGGSVSVRWDKQIHYGQTIPALAPFPKDDSVERNGYLRLSNN